MSLDIIVWLSCSVVLPNALPNNDEWRHYRVTSEQLARLPRELADLLQGSESWDVDRPDYLLRVSYAKKDPITLQRLQSAFPQLDVKVISPEVPLAGESEGDRGLATRAEPLSQRQSELGEKARSAKLGVSLVLEGSYDAGYPEQSAIATHLAEICKGAIVEGPAGYYQIDEHGEWTQ